MSWWDKSLRTKYNHLLLLCFFSLAFFIFLAMVYDSDFVENIDLQLIRNIQGLEHPTFTFIMKFFSYIGDTVRVIVISIIIVLILYKVFHQRIEIILFIIILVGSVILNVLLKYFFQRERPNFYRMIIQDGYSFPSGHAMAALSLYGIITFLLWRHIPKESGRIILICTSTLFITLIGISRIYLGVHYPSDIVGAYLISGSWLLLTIWGFIQVKGKD